VADIGDVICGKTPSTGQPEYYGDDIPFITIPDMLRKIFAVTTQKRLSHLGAASQQNKMLPVGAICVSCIATPGLVVIASEAAQTNQQINSVIPSNGDQRFFWYWILRELGYEIRAGGSGGSVLSNLSTGRFADLRILVPTSELRNSYHSRVAHLFERILATEREAITLAANRDTLLPKLISGELGLKAAETFLGSAV
jgi:type I restriction enzyme S subunit